MVQFVDLWRNHPINESIQLPCIADKDLVNAEGEKVLKDYPVYPHQCSMRMGVCLHRSGVQYGQLGSLGTCGAHPKDEMHFLSATNLANALAKASISGIGPVEKITGADVAQYYPKVFGRTGIIFFQDYWYRSGETGRPTGDHIDVWNGYRTSAKFLLEWFSWLGYYSNYAGAKEIWFWEVK